jgi:hypothetical protein
MPLTVEQSLAQTLFLGSQVGGESVINVAYTDLPLKLLAYDAGLFLKYIWATPWIVLPFHPSLSGELDELSLTKQNIITMFIHLILFFMQLGFILCIPIAIFFPIWMVATGVVMFYGVHWILCRILNGSQGEYTSDKKYALPDPKFDHEQWIFLNGVAVGYVQLAETCRKPADFEQAALDEEQPQSAGLDFQAADNRHPQQDQRHHFRCHRVSHSTEPSVWKL